jgi:hypothetical protein
LIQAAGEFVGILDSAEKKAAKIAEEQAKKAEESLGKVQGTEQKRRTESFQQAIEAVGGGTALLDQFRAEDQRQHPERSVGERERLRSQFAVDVEKGRGGDQLSIDAALDRIGRNSLFGAAFSSRFAGSDPELKAGAKEREEEIKRDQQEQEAHNEAIDDARKKRVEELATNIEAPLSIRKLAGLNVGKDVVRDALTRSEGLTPEDAEPLVDAVLEKFNNSLSEAIRKRAGEKGLDTKGAEADLLIERAKEFGKDNRQFRETAENEGVRASLFGGPLSKSQTFSSAVDFERFAQQSVLSGGGGQEREQVDLLRDVKEAVNKVAEHTDPQNPRRRPGSVVLSGPD